MRQYLNDEDATSNGNRMNIDRNNHKNINGDRMNAFVATFGTLKEKRNLPQTFRSRLKSPSLFIETYTMSAHYHIPNFNYYVSSFQCNGHCKAKLRTQQLNSGIHMRGLKLLFFFSTRFDGVHFLAKKFHERINQFIRYFLSIWIYKLFNVSILIEIFYAPKFCSHTNVRAGFFLAPAPKSNVKRHQKGILIL